MFVGRQRLAFDRFCDVVHAEDQVIFRRDMIGALGAVGQPQQSDDMAGAGLGDRGVEACEGADVDHVRNNFSTRSVNFLAAVEAGHGAR